VKTYGFTPDAQDEFDHALAVSPDPTELQRVVEAALRDIAAGVITHAAVPRTPCRQCVLTAVPYTIIYTETDDEIRVVAFSHHKRKPGYWKRRLRPN
jgi:toxin ParE1/3/4